MGRVLAVGDDYGRIRVRRGQLIAEPRDPNDPSRSAPCEDLDLVLLDTTQGLSLNLHALQALIGTATAVIVTDAQHMPSGVLLPLVGNQAVGEVLWDQIDMSKPRRKRAWASIVVAKIQNQANSLDEDRVIQRRLGELARTVRSGDPENAEAQAARIYWQRVLPAGIQRNPAGSDIVNGLLNYGYSVVRSLLARSVVLAGLHPAIGVFHSGRRNPFALVDDLIEPFRPVVDAWILDHLDGDETEITPALKRMATEVVGQRMALRGRIGRLPEVAERFADGYRRYVTGEAAQLDTPSRPDGRTQ